MSNTISLKNWQILKANKIRWIIPANNGNPLDVIRSHSLKKFLRNSDQYLINNNISWKSVELNEQDFLKWLTYYTAKMSENGFDILANHNWFLNQIDQHNQVKGLYFYQNEKLVASGIIKNTQNGQSTLSFKASDRIDLTGKKNSSVGAIVDYFFIKEAFSKKFNYISGGRSRNAFGVINTFGYLDYKLKLGHDPIFDLDSPLEDSTLINQAGQVVFYGQKQANLPQFFVYSTNPEFSVSELDGQIPLLKNKVTLLKNNDF